MNDQLKNTRLRTPETWKAYQNKPKSEGCILCEKTMGDVVKAFTYFSIISNDYPYDQICKTHHILVPNSHVPDFDCLGDNSGRELNTIVREFIDKSYDAVLINTPRNMTIPEHAHWHLLTFERL